MDRPWDVACVPVGPAEPPSLDQLPAFAFASTSFTSVDLADMMWNAGAAVVGDVAPEPINFAPGKGAGLMTFDAGAGGSFDFSGLAKTPLTFSWEGGREVVEAPAKGFAPVFVGSGADAYAFDGCFDGGGDDLVVPVMDLPPAIEAKGDRLGCAGRVSGALDANEWATLGPVVSTVNIHDALSPPQLAGSALSRPAMVWHGGGSGLIAVGTQACSARTNRIYIAGLGLDDGDADGADGAGALDRVDQGLGIGLDLASAFPVTVAGPVWDLTWRDSQHLVYAAGSTLAVARYSADDLHVSTSRDMAFAHLHSDDIRQLALDRSPGDGTAVRAATCASDGRVVVTDLEYFVSREWEGEQTVISVAVGASVSSVSWWDDQVVALTTDAGSFALIDLRVRGGGGGGGGGGIGPAVYLASLGHDLYCHARVGSSLWLGFGDGTLAQVDVRDLGPSASVVAAPDPSLRAVGTLCPADGADRFAACGVGHVSLWDEAGAGTTFATYGAWFDLQNATAGTDSLAPLLASSDYVTAGAFLGEELLVMTDSDGNVGMANVLAL